MLLPENTTVVAGEHWKFERLRETIATGAAVVHLTRTSGPLARGSDLTHRERKLLLGGGALSVYRESRRRPRRDVPQLGRL